MFFARNENKNERVKRIKKIVVVLGGGGGLRKVKVR